MSDENITENTTEKPNFKAPENHTHFAFVVDGKLEWLHSVENVLDGAVKVFQSAPTIVEITAEQFEAFLNSGVAPYGKFKLEDKNWVLEK